MAQRKSNNKYYRSADVARPVEALKEIMGLTGNADANYLTNLGKVSRLEGTELDNKKKQGVLDAILGSVEGKDADSTLARWLANSGADMTKLITGEGTRPHEIDFAKNRARIQEQEVEHGDLMATLARSIANMEKPTPPDPRSLETGDQWVKDSVLAGQQADQILNDEALLGAMQRFAALSKSPHTITTDPLGKQGKQLTAGKVKVSSAREALLIAQKEGYKKLNKEKVNQAIKAAEKIIAETEVLKDIGIERRNQIVQKTLDDVNENAEVVKNLKEMNKLIKKRVLTEAERLKGEGFKAEQEKILKDDLPNSLSFKLERLRQLKRKATSLAEIAEVDALSAQKLKGIEIEIAELDKDIKTATKGRAEAQKDRAIDLAEMSELELKALPAKILAEATKKTNENSKLKEQIKLAQARTADVTMGRSVKFWQKKILSNKLAIQKLLAPYQEELAKARVANETGKFAQQTALKMITPPKAEAPLTPKGGIDNFDLLTGFGIGTEDVPDMPAKPYNKMFSDIMELADSGKLKNIDVKNAQGVSPRTQILKSMIQQLNINKTQATQVLEKWLKELLPAPEE